MRPIACRPRGAQHINAIIRSLDFVSREAALMHVGNNAFPSRHAELDLSRELRGDLQQRVHYLRMVELHSPSLARRAAATAELNRLMPLMGGACA